MAGSSFNLLNKAFILKNAWRLLMDNKSIWSQTIKGKYFPQSDIINATSPKNHNSSVWKNIYKISRLLRDACFWILGNGKKINFWKDMWIGNIRIQDYVQNIPPDLQNLRVTDLINWNTKIWKLEMVKP